MAETGATENRRANLARYRRWNRAIAEAIFTADAVAGRHLTKEGPLRQVAERAGEGSSDGTIGLADAVQATLDFDGGPAGIFGRRGLRMENSYSDPSSPAGSRCSCGHEPCRGGYGLDRGVASTTTTANWLDCWVSRIRDTVRIG